MPSEAAEPPHVRIFRAWVDAGITETNGPNRQPIIDYMNRRLRLPLGSPYCGSSWALALDSAGAATPTYRGGLALGYKTRDAIAAKDVLSGRRTLEQGMLGIFRKGATIYGHLVGVDSVISRRTIMTLEGNTSSGRKGSQRDGDGFYRRRRTIAPFDYFGLKYFVPVTYAERSPFGLSSDSPWRSSYAA